MTKSSKVKLFVVKSVLYISISGCSRVIKNVFVSHVWILTVVGGGTLQQVHHVIGGQPSKFYNTVTSER